MQLLRVVRQSRVYDLAMAKRVLHDRYFTQAKAEGYRARSAYKLKEIQQRRRVLRAGDRVLDVGCAPGAWLQVAAEIVGPRGRVIGVDLQSVAPGLPAAVTTHVGDIMTLTSAEILSWLHKGRETPGVVADGSPDMKYDAIISDVAPNTTGAGDHYRSERLCRRVVELALEALRPGGNLVMKIFEGELYPPLLKEMTAMFENAKGFKPDASRSPSREIYIVATGYRGPHATDGPGR